LAEALNTTYKSELPKASYSVDTKGNIKSIKTSDSLTVKALLESTRADNDRAIQYAEYLIEKLERKKGALLNT